MKLKEAVTTTEECRNRGNKVYYKFTDECRMARQKTSIEDSVADADVLSNSRIHLASHKSIEIKKSSVLFLFTRMERTLTVNSERHLLG